MPTMTRAAFRDKMFEQRGATVITMTARTIPTLIGGKSCPLVGLTKVSVVNGMINWSYQNAVNAQRVREGSPTDDNDAVEFFEPKSRAWGKRLHDIIKTRAGQYRMLPLVSKTWKKEEESSTISAAELATLPIEDLYLEFKAGKSLDYKYYLDGQEVSHEEAHKHIRQPAPSKTQGVEHEILVRDYKLVSIEQVTMNGETFELVD